MKTLILIFLGVAVGWFTHDSIVCSIEQIHDWRPPAWWALAAVGCIIGVLFILP